MKPLNIRTCQRLGKRFGIICIILVACLGAFQTRAATAGSVVGWGGFGFKPITVPVYARSNVLAMAAGEYHAVALKGDGSVVVWGDQAPVPVEAQAGITAVAAGGYHTVALKSSGSVVAWGGNSYGQSTVPPAAQSGVIALTAGELHTVALKNDGSVVAWGYNGFGQTFVPPAAQSGVVAIAAGGEHTVALKNDGSVLAWGYNYSGQTTVPMAAQSGVIAIAAGGSHTVALKDNGSVVAWGHNGYGQTSVPVEAQSAVVAIAAGAAHTIALKSDGSVIVWGANGNGQLVVPVEAQAGCIRIAAGSQSSLALVVPTIPKILATAANQTVEAGRNASFTVAATGYPASYQWRRNGINIQGATGATCSLGLARTEEGGAYTVVVTTALGSVTSAPPALLTVNPPLPANAVAWGTNWYGEATIPSWAQGGLIAVAAGEFHTVVLKTNGAVLAWGNNDYGQTTVPIAAQSGVTAIAAGWGHTVALKTNGVVVAWGNNDYGQTAVPVEAQSGVIAIAAGGYHTLALKTNGAVIAWGANSDGQTSVPPAGQSGVSAIEAGYAHSVALKLDGSVIGWGANGYGQTTIPDAAQSGVIAIAAGSGHTIALKNDGSFIGWGLDLYGQTYSLGRRDMSAIAAGDLHTIALWNDGRVEVWGQSQNQSMVPSGLSGVTAISGGGMQTVALYIPSKPGITAEPTDQTVLAGDAAYFSVGATGYPLTFQWRFNNQDIPGANLALLTLENVTSNHVGNYSVVVSNSAGSVTSMVARLKVTYVAPTVSIYNPWGFNPALVGSAVSLCGDVTGAPFPNLQWKLNGTNLPGETNVCLDIASARTNQSGIYTLVASNPAGKVASSPFKLDVIERPVVYAYSTDRMPVVAGYPVSFCSQITLASSYALQWYLNGVPVPGGFGPCLYLYNVSSNDAGNYTLVATTFSGSYTSPPVRLSIYYEPVSLFGDFYFAKGSSNELVGSDITLCQGASGSLPSFQWRFNGVDLPGETNSCLSLLSINTNQVGAYTLVARNPVNTVTSVVQMITVRYQAPVFAYEPADISAAEGTDARFQAFAEAGPPAWHVLQLNGTNTGVPFTYGSYSSGGGFTLLDISAADAGNYRVIASNEFGMSTSAVARLTVTRAGPLDRWTQRNPLPQSQYIYSVCHGTNLFVAVGDRGTIMSSPDGTNWTVQSRRVDLPLRGVTYGAGLFVAVGNGGVVLSSKDGTNWAYRYANPSTTFKSIAFGNGRFVTIDEFQAFALTSTDGVAWAKSAVPSYYAGRGVAFGNGTFVTAGNFAIMTSTNGLDWTVTSNSTVQYECVAFLNNQFFVVGDQGVILVSTNGTSWTSRSSGTTRRLLGMAYGQGTFAAVGVRGTVLLSPDGVTWAAVNSGTPDRLECVDFFKGNFVALGENGTTITSPTFTTWTKQNFGPTRDLDGMALGNGRIVIVGKGGTILTSTNGTDYVMRVSGITNDLHGVGWGNGLWVAVGEPGVILTSSDTVEWTARTTGSTNALKAATWANGIWVVVGTQGTILISSNGIAWAPPSFSGPFYDLNDVAYGNGLYLIAGDGPNSHNGSLVVSSNAITWSVISPIGMNLRGINFANGRFLVTANDGVVYVMTNGFGAGTILYQLPANNLRGAIQAPGVSVAVGNYGTILTTTELTNGAPWARRASRTFENLHKVVYLDGKLVAIGNRGTILQSDRFVTELETPSFNGVNFRLPFKGVVNQAYQVEATTNFVSWTNIASFTNLLEHSVYTDTNALQFGRRFYRLKKP